MNKEVIDYDPGGGMHDIYVYDAEDTFYLVLGNPRIILPRGAVPNQVLEFMGNNSDPEIQFLDGPPRMADNSEPMRYIETFHQTTGLSPHFRLVWVDREGGSWLWSSL